MRNERKCCPRIVADMAFSTLKGIRDNFSCTSATQGTYPVSLLKPSISTMFWTAKINRSRAISSLFLITIITFSTFPYVVKWGWMGVDLARINSLARVSSSAIALIAPDIYSFKAGWRDWKTGVLYFLRRTNISAGYTCRTYSIVCMATSTMILSI